MADAQELRQLTDVTDEDREGGERLVRYSDLPWAVRHASPLMAVAAVVVVALAVIGVASVYGATMGSWVTVTWQEGKANNKQIQTLTAELSNMQGGNSGWGLTHVITGCPDVESAPSTVLQQIAEVDLTYDNNTNVFSGGTEYERMRLVGDHHLYVTTGSNSRCTVGNPNPYPSLIRIFDMSLPCKPVELAPIVFPNFTDLANYAIITDVNTPFAKGALLVVGPSNCIAVASMPANFKGGMYVFNITDPGAPVLITGPFGDPSVTAGCTFPTGGFHVSGGIRGYATGRGKVILEIADCTTLIIGVPQATDQWDLTNPAAPFLRLDNWNRNSPQLIVKQQTPALIEQNFGFFSDLVWDWYAHFGPNNETYVTMDYGDLGVHVINVTNPDNYTIISRQMLPQFDPIYPQFRIAGRWDCSRRSPDGSFIFVGQNHDGYYGQSGASATTPIDLMNIQSGPDSLRGQQRATRETPGTRQIASLPFGQLCGIAVWGGYACNTSGIPLASSLPPLTTPNDAYILVVQQAAALNLNYDPSQPFICTATQQVAVASSLGYTNVLVASNFLNLFSVTNGAAQTEAPFVLPSPLAAPTTVVAGIGFKTGFDVFALPPNYAASAVNVTRPPLGGIGLRVCIYKEVYQGAGGAHLLLTNTTTVDPSTGIPILQDVASFHHAEQWMPSTPTNRRWEFAPNSCPSIHRDKNMVIWSFRRQGISLFSYGGSQVGTDGTNTYGLDLIGKASAYHNDTGFDPLIEPNWFYPPNKCMCKDDHDGASFFATISRVQPKLRVFMVPAGQQA